MLKRVCGLLATAGAGAVACALVSVEKAEAFWVQPPSGAPAFHYGAWRAPGGSADGASDLRGNVGDAETGANTPAGTGAFAGRSRGAGGALQPTGPSGDAAGTGQGAGGPVTAFGEFKGGFSPRQTTGEGGSSTASGASGGESGASQTYGRKDTSSTGQTSHAGASASFKPAGVPASFKTASTPGGFSGAGRSGLKGGNFKPPSHPGTGSGTGQTIGSGGSTKTPGQPTSGPTTQTTGSSPTLNLQSGAGPSADPGLKPGDTVTYTSYGLGYTSQVYIIDPPGNSGYYNAGMFQLQTTAHGTVLAFCVDLPTQILNSGTYTVGTSSSLSTSLKLTTTQIGEIGAVLVHAEGLIGDATSTNTAGDIGAALQLVIWDIEYAPDFAFAASGVILSDYTAYLSDVQNDVWPEFFNYVSLNEAGNQTLVALPEPSTWAMMGVGFAGLGFASWRASRKKTKALAAAG